MPAVGDPAEIGIGRLAPIEGAHDGLHCSRELVLGTVAEHRAQPEVLARPQRVGVARRLVPLIVRRDDHLAVRERGVGRLVAARPRRVVEAHVGLAAEPSAALLQVVAAPGLLGQQRLELGHRADIALDVAEGVTVARDLRGRGDPGVQGVRSEFTNASHDVTGRVRPRRRPPGRRRHHDRSRRRPRPPTTLASRTLESARTASAPPSRAASDALGGTEQISLTIVEPACPAVFHASLSGASSGDGLMRSSRAGHRLDRREGHELAQVIRRARAPRPAERQSRSRSSPSGRGVA